MIYDTLKLSRALRDRAHFSQDQAEGLAEVLNDSAMEKVVAKVDVAGIKSAIKEDLVGVRTDIKAEIKFHTNKLEAQILWFLAMQSLAIAIMIVVVVDAICRAKH